MLRLKHIRVLFSINNAQMETTKENVIVSIPDFNEIERIIILILQRLQLEHEKIAGKNTDRAD